MFTIKNYDQWVFESSENSKNIRDKASDFLRRIREALEKEGFKWNELSSPLQIKNGTLLMNNVTNEKFSSQKIKDWKVLEYNRRPGVSEKDILDLKNAQLENDNNNRVIIYSNGSVKYADNKFKFDAESEDGLEMCIDWLKKKLAKVMILDLKDMIMPNEIIIPKDLVGYDLPPSVIDLIEASIGDNFAAVSGQDFTIKTLLKSFTPELRKIVSPFLVAAYMYSQTGQKIITLTGSKEQYVLGPLGNVSCALSDLSMLYLKFDKYSGIMIRQNSEIKLSKDMQTISFPSKIAVSKGRYMDPLKYEQVLKELSENAPGFEKFLEMAQEPIEDLQQIAHDKRGFIAKKKFGF